MLKLIVPVTPAPVMGLGLIVSGCVGTGPPPKPGVLVIKAFAPAVDMISKCDTPMARVEVLQVGAAPLVQVMPLNDAADGSGHPTCRFH